MRSWFQSTIGLIVTIIVLAGCFAFFAVRIATRSHPQPYSESSQPVGDSTWIYRNTFGIPHIVARNEHDMFFAQGYAHAQDRLWQMDVWRRVGRGRLAEILGREVIDVDLFMRGVGISDIAHKQMGTISATSRKTLKAYAEGVNAFIREHRSEMPFEFDALEYQPELWTEEDCLVVGRVLAFELSLAFWSDLAYSQIAAQCGIERARMYIPSVRSAPYVLDTTSARPSLAPADTARRAPSPTPSSTAMLDVLQPLMSGMAVVREKLGITGSSVGSNCWAVRSDSGNAIVANDPHMGMALPPKWMQVHLSAPGFNVLGMSVPGMPLVFSGRNNSLAWGFSNVMVDDVDYVLEKVDTTNSNYYFTSGGQRKRFKDVTDTFRIKDSPDSLVSYRYTTRGCVISDVHLLRKPSAMFDVQRRMATTLLTRSCLTFRWTARYASDEVLAMYKINKAATFAGVQEAVGTWYAPALNISVGTATGTIGSVLAGVIPNRGTSDPHFLIPGQDAAADWTGITHLRTLGSMVNPARGYVFSANNVTIPGTSPFITTLYEPPSRSERIHNQLRIYRDYTARDAQIMQSDVVSPYSKALVDKVAGILQRGSARFGATEKQALKMLLKWDGTMSQVDPTASIWATFFQKLVYHTFEDELGTQLYYDYIYISSIPTRKLAELLDQPQHVLWDDVRTKQHEDMGWIVMRAFVEAVGELRTRMQNDNPASWRYEFLHTISFEHRFGQHALMAPVMNHGPFGIGGSNTTINNTEWRLWDPYRTRVAASMRLISDMADTIQYSVVPGGASGQPLDAHYADQIQLWLKGGYVRLPVRPEPDVTFRLFNIFTPAGR